MLAEFDQIDSWLEPEDIDRIYAAAEGRLPESAVTDDELQEFQRIVDHLIMIKQGGSGYQQATIQ
jgi:hypothetical protein